MRDVPGVEILLPEEPDNHAAITAFRLPGMKAPAFTAADQDGHRVSLSDFLGKKNVCLYFYPKDDTPGCTAEACSLRTQALATNTAPPATAMAPGRRESSPC